MKKLYLSILCLCVSLLLASCSLGQAGPQGEAGKSAYDIAVENGFKGTEAEWLASRTGPIGNPPQVRINETTRLWEASYDNGATWVSLNFDSTSGTKGDAGVGIESIEIDYRGYACITLTTGEVVEVKIDESCEHNNMSDVITSPTCAQRGYTTHECLDCGMIYVNNYVEKTGHHFVDKICSVCKVEEPFGEIPISTEWYTVNTANTTYQIANREQLAGLAYLVNNGTNFAGKTIILTADIDLSGAEWIPIGTENAPFAGDFDGYYYSIYDMKISNQTSYVGLFGYVTGTLKRVNVINANVNVEGVGTNIAIACGCAVKNFSDITVSGYVNAPHSTNVGGVVGQAALSGNAEIGSCKNAADVIGADYVGGIAGAANDTISNYHNAYTFTVGNMENTGSIAGANYVGGIFGQLYANNYDRYSVKIVADGFTNSGNVSGETMVGGVFGYVYSDITESSIANTSSCAAVTAEALLGGIAGKIENASFQTSNNEGSVINATGYVIENGVSKTYVGGYIGYLSGSCLISGCENKSDIIISSKGNYVGGVAGYVLGFMQNCTNSGTISAPESLYVGGIVGELNVNATRELFDCKNTGNVTGFDYVGGIAGNLSDYVSDYHNAYTLTVHDMENTAGIIGKNYVGGLFGQLYANNADRYAVKIVANDLDNTGDVVGEKTVGGIAGNVYSDDQGSTVTDVTSNASVTAETILGGIIGKAENISLVSSSNNGSRINITGYIIENNIYKAYAGGYIGYALGACSVIECNNESDILYSSKGNYVGGIAGYIVGYVQNCTNSGTISAPDSAYVGGIAGEATCSGNYEWSNCKNNGNVAGSDYAGGIVGSLTDQRSDYHNAYTLNLHDIENTASIAGKNYVGGLFGQIYANNADRYAVKITMNDVVNSGDVTGETNVGGISGYVYSDTSESTITDAVVTSVITAEAIVGGFIGRAENISVISSSNEGTVINASGYIIESGVYKAYVGGYIGYALGNCSVLECSNSTEINYTSKGDYIGGIAGYIVGCVQNCTNSATVSAPDSSYVGGIAGYAISNGNYEWSNCNNTGNVTGLDYVGGIIGSISDTISNYNNNYTLTLHGLENTANITGKEYVGGLCGYVYANNGDRCSVIITGNDNANSGNVSGESIVGGIFGYAYSDSADSTLTDTTSTGEVTGNEAVSEFIPVCTNVQII